MTVRRKSGRVGNGDLLKEREKRLHLAYMTTQETSPIFVLPLERETNGDL